MDYQWYPGHMTKAMRMMQENIKLVDIVIEIIDARLPVSSRNPDIDRLAQGKQRILIMGKADLADPESTKAFVAYYEAQGMYVAAIDSRAKGSVKDVRILIDKAAAAKRAKDLKRGIKNRPVRVMVCGIPNVGKSTFINSLIGRGGAKTGNKPGVTKGKQWLSVKQGGGTIELLDTPGVLWPKFEDRTVGIRLALTGSIREEILDEEELARELLSALIADYPEVLDAKYAPEGTSLADAAAIGDDARLHAILEEIAMHRRFLAKGETPDAHRAAHMLLVDMRDGRTGRITLDKVPVGGDNTDKEQPDPIG